MISDRYDNDGLPTWKMDDVQIKYKELLEKKIFSGAYELECVDTCICGGQSFEVLSKKDRFGLNFEALLCMECGLVSTSPRLCDSSLEDFYNNIYWGLTIGSYKADAGNYRTSINFEANRFDFLASHISDECMTIVEIGCGSGHNLAYIRDILREKNQSVEVFGCDYSEECAEYGNREYNIPIYIGNSESMLARGIKSDLVILSHVFEHYTDLLHEIRNLKKLLKKNGMVYIEVPGILDLKNKMEYSCDFIDYLTLAHNYCFSLGTLENVMKMGRFKLVDGNENVCSIFKLDSEGYDISEIKNHSTAIWEYLIDLEQNRSSYWNKLIARVIFGIREEETYVLYGTSEFSKLVTRFIDSFGGKIFSYSDSDCEKWGSYFEDKLIIAPEELVKYKNQFSKIIIASSFTADIVKSLEDLSFDKERDMLLIQYETLRKYI